MLSVSSVGSGGRRACLAAIAIVAVGCFKHPADNVQQMTCTTDKECPEGYQCALPGTPGGCHKSGQTTNVASSGGAGGSLDGATPDRSDLGPDVAVNGGSGGTSIDAMTATSSGGAGAGGARQGTGGGSGGVVSSTQELTGGQSGDVGSGGVAGTGGVVVASGGVAQGTGGAVGKGGAPGTGGIALATGGAPGTGGTLAACPKLDDPSNGTVSMSGGIATYNCLSGYLPPSPADKRTCQADGTWSGVVPACNPVDCGPPPNVSHATASGAGTTYGASTTYTCSSGYRMAGTAKLTCQANAAWSGTAPTCSAVDCGAAPSIANATVQANQTTYQGTATYTCKTGFAFVNATTSRVCQADGNWSTPAPSCAIQMLTLTLSKPGSGTGKVVSSDSGISCGTTCSASFAYGTVITLTATADAGQTFVGWAGAGCKGTGVCSFTISSDTSVSATFSPPPNIMFVTSTTQSAASLGGLGGADAICAQAAARASLAGTYVAWLSTATVSAASRLNGATGWARPDGKPVFNTVADIDASRFFYPPRLDEKGTDLGTTPSVLTGTTVDGTFASNHGSCTSYTANDGGDVQTGLASSNSVAFTQWLQVGCTEPAHLYCLGIDRKAQMVPTPVSGRYAFISKSTWSPGGGLGSADNLCQSEATNAGLPGTYAALLAPTGETPASRFSTTGLPWIRPDGIPITQTVSTFFTTTLWDTSPNMSADGSTYYSAYFGTWSGAANGTTAGTAVTNCSNWTSSSTTASASGGGAGQTSTADFFGYWSGVIANLCSAGNMHLACLQK